VANLGHRPRNSIIHQRSAESAIQCLNPECASAMVFSLRVNVLQHGPKLTRADREYAITARLIMRSPLPFSQGIAHSFALANAAMAIAAAAVRFSTFSLTKMCVSCPARPCSIIGAGGLRERS
jgi:hypothetical protein